MVDIINKLLIFIFIVILASFFITLFFFLSDDTVSGVIPGFNEDNKDQRIDLDDSSLDDDSSTIVGGSSGSGAGSSGSGGSGLTCTQEQVSYSLTDLNPFSFCKSVQDNTCVEKEVTCRSTIRNINLNVGGNFEIVFSIHEELDINNVFDVGVNSGFAEPNQTILIKLTRVLNETYADFNISCSSLTLIVPTEEVCV